jgi:hypothetical protein
VSSRSHCHSSHAAIVAPAPEVHPLEVSPPPQAIAAPGVRLCTVPPPEGCTVAPPSGVCPGEPADPLGCDLWCSCG